MCGRYTLPTPADQVAEMLDAELQLEPGPPRYNIAPTQEAPIVRTVEPGRRELVAARWGLVPWWADEPSIGNRLINARSETAATRKAFRDA
ncbi:MAG: SOS response-associated peptidase family protein, partial [Thermoanaerobaculia bacterium]|nr:SOS response-associated peptidase family protein [Thermoanaerobaculia bacterium]